MSENNDKYDSKTLLTAAALLIGFGILLYLLPSIMMTVGEQNRWLAGAIVVAILTLPFVGLWLRGRARRGK